MTKDNYKAFAITFCEALRQIVDDAYAKKQSSVGTEKEDFDAGYLCGFHRVVTLIKQQAELFDIPLAELSMDDLDEMDLM